MCDLNNLTNLSAVQFLTSTSGYWNPFHFIFLFHAVYSILLAEPQNFYRQMQLIAIIDSKFSRLCWNLSFLLPLGLKSAKMSLFAHFREQLKPQLDNGENSWCIGRLARVGVHILPIYKFSSQIVATQS